MALSMSSLSHCQQNDEQIWGGGRLAPPTLHLSAPEAEPLISNSLAACLQSTDPDLQVAGMKLAGRHARPAALTIFSSEAWSSPGKPINDCPQIALHKKLRKFQFSWPCCDVSHIKGFEPVICLY